MNQITEVSLDELGRISMPAAIRSRRSDLTSITQHERDRRVLDLLQRVGRERRFPLTFAPNSYELVSL